MGEGDELLTKAWEGEVLGEHLFSRLTVLLPDDREVWMLLARLEHTMGAMVAEVGRAHAVEIDVETMARAGEELAAAVQPGGRDELCRSALAVVGDYVPLYEQLRDALPEDERWLGDELVVHERAFESLLSGLLEGRADPGADVAAFLARHAGPSGEAGRSSEAGHAHRARHGAGAER